MGLAGTGAWPELEGPGGYWQGPGGDWSGLAEGGGARRELKGSGRRNRKKLVERTCRGFVWSTVAGRGLGGGGLAGIMVRGRGQQGLGRRDGERNKGPCCSAQCPLLGDEASPVREMRAGMRGRMGKLTKRVRDP